MRHFDLHTDTARIRDALDDLQVAWQETSEHWSDAVSREFCRNRLDPMGPTFKLALDAIGRMSQLVDQLQKDCES